MPRKKKLPDFEQALEELEAVIERMERGELSLEESLQNFERGIQLTRNCQAALKQAEQKVEVLMEKNLDSEPVAFTDDDADAASARDSD